MSTIALESQVLCSNFARSKTTNIDVRCHRAGKSRYVTIRDAAVVPSTKHPEDKHTCICEPITLEDMSQMCIN